MAKGKYEGSPADMRKDRAAAKHAGMTQKAFENSPADRRMDRAGQAKLDRQKTRGRK